MAARKKKPAKRKAVKKKTSGKRYQQPPFVPTDEQRKQVEVMVGIGMTYVEMAQCLINPRTGKGISTQTLQNHFQTELQSGAAKVKSAVVGSLYKRATDMSHPQGAACAIFIAKCRYGFQEKHSVEVTSKTGVLVVPGAMSPEDWIAAQVAIDAAKKPPEEDG